MTALVPGVDYDVSVCPNCGDDVHTERQLRRCLRSIIAPPCRCDEGRRCPRHPTTERN